MVFLDPKTDVAFKKLFGDSAYKNVVISFLNSILNRKGKETIVDVTMNDPYNHPETVVTDATKNVATDVTEERKSSKSSIVDIKCTDQAKNRYIIEMQVVRQSDYLERAQYYSSVALSRQLKSTEPFGKLDPVIFVGVLDFTFFSNPNYVTHHILLDQETHEHVLKHLTFHFIELKKFNKELQELTNLTDQWIYFLKNAHSMETIPNSLKDPDINDAFHILNKSTWPPEQLELYDRDLDAIRSEPGKREAAKEEGREIGKAEGIEIGKVEGEKNAQIKIAKQLLDILDVETVAKKTGLDVEIVKKLKSE